MAIRVIIKQCWHQKFFLEVNLTDAVAAVKNRIREKEGLPMGVRHFLFKEDGLELEEGRTLLDYDIKDGNSLLYTAQYSRVPPPSHEVHETNLAFDAANRIRRSRSRSPRRRADGE